PTPAPRRAGSAAPDGWPGARTTPPAAAAAAAVAAPAPRVTDDRCRDLPRSAVRDARGGGGRGALEFQDVPGRQVAPQTSEGRRTLSHPTQQHEIGLAR